MTLTKKSLALAMALFMVLSLALVALPQEAQAADPASFSIEAYTMRNNEVYVAFTVPAGTLSYKITGGTATVSVDAGFTAGSSVNHTIAGAVGPATITVTCYENATYDGGQSSASKSIVFGTPNITLTWVPSATMKVASGNFDGTPFTDVNKPTAVFRNSTLAFSITTLPGVFSGNYTAHVSNATLTNNAPNFSATNFTAMASTVTIGGGTIIGGTPGWGSSIYPDTYVSRGDRNYYGKGDLTYNVNGPKHKLVKVGVNRQLLTEGTHYSVSSDGANKINITFFSSFLNTLPLGYNRFAFSFTDGASHVEIRVHETNPGSGSGGVINGNGSALRSLTIYNKASSKGRKLGTYAKGADIRVKGFTSSGSYAIVDFGGQTGYAKADYVETLLSSPMTGRTSGSVYLYTRASTSSKYQYAKVSKNTTLTLLGREGSYWLVDFNNEELYVRAKSVKNLTVG